MKEKSLQLIKVYYTICECKDNRLFNAYQRLSPNSSPKFTDLEVITSLLFAFLEGQANSIKQSYNFIKDYWISWFPDLPSYQTYNYRLNKLKDVLQSIISYLIKNSIKYFSLHSQITLLLDSMPVIMASGRRKPKVAPDLNQKGYNASKKMFYYRVKLHTLAIRQKGTIPFPFMIGITPANTHDLIAVEETLVQSQELKGTLIFADKAYVDASFTEKLNHNNCKLYAPDKIKKGEAEINKLRDASAHKMKESFIAHHRQPIESFFNWIIEKFNIQNGAKIRSRDGIFVHIYTRLIAALLIAPISNS